MFDIHRYRNLNWLGKEISCGIHSSILLKLEVLMMRTEMDTFLPKSAQFGQIRP
jgi:hypothetical protein